MSPTAAARTSTPSASSLRDRLKDPSLLRDRCYIDGAWTGTPANPVTNPVNGVELAKVPKMSTAVATQAVAAAERAFPAWAKLTAKQRSNTLRKWFEHIVASSEALALILPADHAVELSMFDDHPESLAGARRRLHRGAETRQRNAAHRAGAGGAGGKGRGAQGRVQYPHR